jgi:hypothetical protein
MADYPIVFTFNDAVAGNGFLAGVTLSGRAVLTKENGSWWAYGVRPAALAASGETALGAYLEFRKSFTAVLFDTASFSGTFEAFKAEVERFFHERDEAEEQRWQTAGDAIRNGLVELEPPFDKMPRVAPDVRPVSISVERLDRPEAVFTASDNVLENHALATAA